MVGLAALIIGTTCRVVRADGAVTTVADTGALRQAVLNAKPGDIIKVAAGEYRGTIWLENVHGAEGAPIIIEAEEPDNPPVIHGGTECMHFVDASWVELRGLTLTGASGNGLNIDDGGSYDTPTHHITLRDLTVTDIGPDGNHDGIKLSGVDDFLVQGCTIERWGRGGSAIDMVGCHRGLITGCTFRHEPLQTGSGIQNKGGTTDIVIRRNLFENAGARAVNIGGSTGLQYFRPPPQGYEAKDITVEGNVFVGAQAPVAFVGADGATVRFNTFYLPGKWVMRILQETREPGFVPCRNGVFTDNIVVFRSDRWGEGGVNIGPATAPETFSFARNLWYCLDRPERSRPSLPAAETDGLVGVDPQFVDPGNGDFDLKPGSPAEGKGHTALPEP
ncbi:MAG: right-handed parallel beta-helix repeat-containing protein [Armatimonadetes bacterium]|nr:right-handed parallel beta-helix repeat-containing protein [Armatimonadota bacterium]